MIQDRIAEARAALDRAGREAAASNGPCSGCAHGRPHRYYGFDRPGGSYGNATCVHPLVQPPHFDRVSGELRVPEVPCYQARDDRGECGPAGTLFEPARWPVRFWRWLQG